jgi:hypothetical protein
MTMLVDPTTTSTPDDVPLCTTEERTRSVMAGLPEITIAETPVADPELRFAPTGAAVANFTVAPSDNADGDRWADDKPPF